MNWTAPGCPTTSPPALHAALTRNGQDDANEEQPARPRPHDVPEWVAATGPDHAVTNPQRPGHRDADDNPHLEDRRNGRPHGLVADRLPDDLTARRQALHAALARDHDRGRSDDDHQMRQQRRDVQEPVAAAERTLDTTPDVSTQQRDVQPKHEPSRPPNQSRNDDRDNRADLRTAEPDRERDAHHEPIEATPNIADDRTGGIAM